MKKSVFSGTIRDKGSLCEGERCEDARTAIRRAGKYWEKWSIRGLDTHEKIRKSN